jgi:hypothetical protein
MYSQYTARPGFFRFRHLTIFERPVYFDFFNNQLAFSSPDRASGAVFFWSEPGGLRSLPKIPTYGVYAVNFFRPESAQAQAETEQTP